MQTVEEACETKGLNLTPVRRRVLEVLLEGHQARTAYELLDVLREEGMGSAPPVVYRALEFLQKNGFVHKLESRNAFVACADPSSTHDPAFLICRGCDMVAETKAGPRPDLQGFAAESIVHEIQGLCPNCAEAQS